MVKPGSLSDVDLTDLTGCFWAGLIERISSNQRSPECPEVESSGRKLSPEQSVGTLRQIEVPLAQGMKLVPACKEAGISEQSYHRWRKEYGGVAVEQAKRLKELERENARLRCLVADLSLEKQVLKDGAAGNL